MLTTNSVLFSSRLDSKTTFSELLIDVSKFFSRIFTRLIRRKILEQVLLLFHLLKLKWKTFHFSVIKRQTVKPFHTDRHTQQTILSYGTIEIRSHKRNIVKWLQLFTATSSCDILPGNRINDTREVFQPVGLSVGRSPWLCGDFRNSSQGPVAVSWISHCLHQKDKAGSTWETYSRYFLGIKEVSYYWFSFYFSFLFWYVNFHCKS